MAEAGAQEKSEKPTQRRLDEARKKGNIAKSMDLSTAVVLLAGLMAVKLQFGEMSGRMTDITTRAFTEFPKDDITTGGLIQLFIWMSWQFALIAGPCLLMLLAAGLSVNYLQVGVLFTTEPLRPSLDKINPLNGFKRMFSRRSLVEVGKAIFKMGVVSTVAYRALMDAYPMLAATALMDRAGVALLYANVAWEIAWRSIGVLLVFALADFFYQKWEYEKGLKMSKQEIKDEAKQSEGDPLVKGRIRRAQREAARRRMMQDVPKATVVITNPTHVAVALRYDRETMAAPVVVAKGLDLVAQKIKEIAAENGVPMVENVPLARAMHKRLEIDEVIPEDLFAAVAEILVMVQKVNKRKGEGRPAGVQVPRL